MAWDVRIKKKVAKHIRELPQKVQEQIVLLTQEIQLLGPVRGNWRNYSKLGGEKHHCHVKDGHPSYVVCWEAVDKKIQIIEVYYAGTREKAPY